MWEEGAYIYGTLGIPNNFPYWSVKNKREMLTNILRALVNNPFKESFMRKKN